MFAPVAALACAAGTLVAGCTATAARVPQAAPAARSLPAHVFAPYYFSASDTLAAASKASGVKYVTLAFLQTPEPGSCTVDWNGDPKQPVGPTYAEGIAAIQAEGGNVVPSFGGGAADSAGEELADSCTSVPAIAAQYEKVIHAYHVTRLDLDTEENSLNNDAGIDRRNKAIAMVERWAAEKHRTVQFVYTLPTDTTGLDQGGSYVLQNAAANHAQIAIVNAMTFDYYDSLPHEMGDETEGAALQLYDRLHELYPGKTAARLWGMIGVTEDLGVDDFGAAETFTLADARTVERWAAARGLAELSFWDLQDDNNAGSHVKQTSYEYSRIFAPFTSSLAVSGAPLAPVGRVAQHGNLRSVSCPAAAFCMAVDESGNNALTWNGTAWSGPVPIDAGGAAVELTDVSCASPGFCVAVDTLGRALTWDGAGWTAARIDQSGLTSVSCPEETYCVAVDGDGNALTWNGTAWSAARIDRTGSSLQSVSCASPSFCAAGDWDGNVYTWNGTAWSAPRAVDPAGGGVSSMSCPASTFCAGTDWNGGAVRWNGTRWSLDKSADGGGAGGLMSVSCVSASFCALADSGGDVLTWNGAKWSSPAQIDPTGDGIESVSCASRSSCVAVDWNGNALIGHGTSWSMPAISCPGSTTSGAGTCYTRGTYVDPRAGVLDSVSCASGSLCVAVDGNGTAMTGSAVADIDPIAGILASVSCADASFCMAVDMNGYAFSFNGTSWSVPAWSAASRADRRGPLEAVSCASRWFCMAVDGNGNALRWTGRSWSAPASADPAGQLTGVSCASPTACVAVDARGNLLRWDGRSWTAVPLGGGYLTGVSCAGPDFCAVVGTRGAWTVQASPPGGGGLFTRAAGLTSVSCASAASCIAVSSAGAVLGWNGHSWSAPVTVDPAGGGLTGVSCSAPGACVAIDFAGKMLRLPSAEIDKASSKDKRHYGHDFGPQMKLTRSGRGIQAGTADLIPGAASMTAVFSLAGLAEACAAQNRPICTTRSGMACTVPYAQIRRYAHVVII